MPKPINIRDPDGELEYDGDELTEEEEEEYENIMEAWREFCEAFNL